jgi:hypothetical protein
MRRERLRIGIAPRRVDLARRSLWGRSWQDLGQGCEPEPGAAAWSGALRTLDSLLAQAQVRRQAATVVLSNQWMRSVVLPWHAHITARTEIEALARARLVQRHGTPAEGWVLRTALGGWGEPHVVCAIEPALLEQLREAMSRHGVALGSLQPLWVSAFNALRSRLRSASVLVVVEDDGVCMALAGARGWLDVSWRRTAGNLLAVVREQVAVWGCSLPQLQQPDFNLSIDVVLVGEGASWPARPSPIVRVLRGQDAGRRPSLALCGVASDEGAGSPRAFFRPRGGPEPARTGPWGCA